jgi:hypothetical protein
MLLRPDDYGFFIVPMTFPVRRANSADRSSSAELALTAAMMLAAGSSLDGHLLFLIGLPLTAAGFIVACYAAVDWGRPDGHFSLSWICGWLSVMVALGIVNSSIHDSLWYEILRRSDAVAGVALVGLFASGDRRWQSRATMIAVGLSVFLAVMTPLGTPNPEIDVFAWTQTSVHALLHGTHPYTVVAPDVYRGRYDFGYAVSVYPYMPATLLAYLPWVGLFGDFRFASAACIPLTIGFIRAIGRRLALDPQLIGAATLAVLFHPAAPRIVQSGWTEPLLVACAGAFVYLALRNPEGFGQAAAFCLLPACKQYVVAPVLMYLPWATANGRRRALIAGALFALATAVPFLVWNWRATLAGIIFQMRAPTVPRLGSTSVVALMAVTAGVYPGRWTSVAVQMIVGGVAWSRLRTHGLGGLVLASALSLYATFLTGWQAFVNYYYFVGALLVFAAMLAAGAEEVA